MKILNLFGLLDEPDFTIRNELLKYFNSIDIVSRRYKYETLDPSYIVENACNKKYDLIVGAFVGGFFAGVIGSETNTRVIAINPTIPADLIIPKLAAEITGNEYAYTKELTELSKQTNYNNVTAILGRSDEIVDHTVTAKYIKDHTYIDGGHFLSGKEFSDAFYKAIFKPKLN